MTRRSYQSKMPQHNWLSKGCAMCGPDGARLKTYHNIRSPLAGAFTSVAVAYTPEGHSRKACMQQNQIDWQPDVTSAGSNLSSIWMDTLQGHSWCSRGIKLSGG